MLYNLAIVIYDFIVHLAAPFSRKPRKMMKGHWVVYELLRQQVEKGEQYIWFHAASLGEFEQGRPLIEMIRAKYPNYKILLTFFSPSGYEVRKHYRGADIVCYLPFDKPRNVKKFLDIANPCMAFFIKYEFWKNYLDELHKRRIPVIFGPKYQKFMEAVQLLEAKGAYSIKDYDELKTLLDRFLADELFLRETGTNAGYYVTSNAGATEKIMHMINF